MPIRYAYVTFNEIKDGVLKYHTHYDLSRIEYINLANRFKVTKYKEY